MSLPLVHVITPGDHYSPRTGSAVPTVVDGLARAAAAAGLPRPAVAVAHGTYPDRYDSAEVREYAPRPARAPDRWLDAGLSRLGLPRAGARRVLGATVRDQDAWAPSVVVAHNAPALLPLVGRRHTAVLWAHNQVLRSYSLREAGRVVGRAGAVVCVSDHLAGELAPRLPAGLRGRVVTVRNGVDAAAFDRPRRPRGDALHVVVVGRVVPDKGADVLLRAVARLRRDDVQVTVVGRPGFGPDDPVTPYEQHLRRLAADVPGGVRFASFVPRTELPDVLAGADVVVVPSVWPEPFGLTALEGMAAGAAVVASRVGGLPEAVGDAAHLVPPGDVGALAAVLDHLADDEDALRADQARARAHAVRQDWSARLGDLDAALALAGAGAAATRADAVRPTPRTT